MKILLIGTIVRDIIEYLDGSIFKAFGGLTHSINAALALCEEEDKLIPVSRIGKDIYNDIQNMWPDEPNLIRDGFLRDDKINNYVKLRYINESERIEQSLNPMKPLNFEDIKPLLSVDLVLVNLISGWDVRLEFIQQLRKNFDGIISVDIHSLTLGRSGNGTRYFRRLPDIKPWLDSADIIQLNMNEYRMIAEEDSKPEDFFLHTCAQSDKIFNLTNGEQGSKSILINKNGSYNVIKTPSAADVKVVDPTGCGDTFLAAFGIHYFKHKDVHLAARQANITAALAGSIKGSPDSGLLRKKLAMYSREVE